LQVKHAFLAVGDGVDDEIHYEQDAAADRPLHPKIESPEECYAAEVTQKEWGVADGQERAADVADQEDKKDDGVNNMFTFGVGLEQRADEQHAGAGRTDETGDTCADGKNDGVGEGAGGEISLEADPTTDDVQAEQQHDERDVFRRHCMIQLGQYNFGAFSKKVVPQR